MLLYPAIDLRDGKCVRLRQGDYAQETIFGDDPVIMARRWFEQGAQFLHLVDLDGAKAGRPSNTEVIRRIVDAVPIPCQLGGGLRNDDALAEVFNLGVQRAIIGTRALQNAGWVQQIAEKYPNRIVLGLDARNGKIATDGWLHVSDVTVLDVARQFASWPLAAIVATDIARDGMLAGPNVEALAELAAITPHPVIASGGVTTLDDIRQLVERKIPGAIIGRALYEGQLDLSAALALVTQMTAEDSLEKRRA